MAFQPYNPTEKLLYPSAQQQVGPSTYATNGLTATGDRLYGYRVGDYAYPSLVPIPHVELTLFDITAATVNITVYRIAAGRTMPVRGQINVYAVGGRNVVDWEAPFGIPLTYRAEQFDADGNSLGYTNSFSTQLDVEQTWAHNPFNPLKGISVRMADDAGATMSRPIPTDTYWAVGGGTAVGISSQRRGLVDVPASFLTDSEADADTARSWFGNPYVSPSAVPVIVIRTGSKQKKMRFPQPFFALIPDPVETPLTTQTGGSLTRWECSATEVSPPAPILVGAVLTYDDLDASYSTYGARDATYSSYLEQDRDYSLAGAAGDNT